jgi:hypothetical protein
MRVWPTFFVIDPVTGGVLGSYGGSLSLDEMTAFMERAQKARGSADVGAQKLVLAQPIQRSDAPMRARLNSQAGMSLTTNAASRCPAVWSHWEAEDYAACVLRQRTGSVTAQRRVISALTPVSAPRSCPRATRRRLEDSAAAKLRAILAEPPTGASVDDRADVLAALAEIAREAKDAAKARELEEKRLALLEADVAKATSPKQEQVHDYERMLALIALGRAEEAVSLLTARTRNARQLRVFASRLAFEVGHRKRPSRSIAPSRCRRAETHALPEPEGQSSEPARRPGRGRHDHRARAGGAASAACCPAGPETPERCRDTARSRANRERRGESHKIKTEGTSAASARDVMRQLAKQGSWRRACASSDVG